MIQVLSQKLAAQSRFVLQSEQYTEKIPLSDTIPAGTTKLCKTNVSNLGHFLCLRITGHYETLGKYNVTTGAVDNSGSICDDGICHLRAQIQDGAGQRIMFSDYTPLDLFLSPGRTRSVNATNNLIKTSNVNPAADAPALFYPDEFEYLFTANSDILMSIKNDSNADCAVDILFHGVRILSRKSVSGIR
jgi:hypothetical protein